MFNRLIVVLAMAFFLSIAVGNVAYATCGSWWNPCPEEEPEPETGNGEVTVNTDIENEVDISNRNYNTNTNLNKNSNRNYNTNIQGQGQKQAQGQLQGQLQGQAQSANNEGNHQSIKFEAPKRGLIGSQYRPHDSARVTNHGDTMSVKAMGSLWNRLDGMTYDRAKSASKGASDIDLEFALLFENDFRTLYINKGASGEFMGYIYVMPTGTDCTLAQMEARALKEAMKAGANFAILFATDGKYLEGSSWNVGLSGGASMMAKGDDIAIAPNGGLGYGKAYSNNEIRPAVIGALYIQPDMIFEKVEKNPDRYEITR